MLRALWYWLIGWKEYISFETHEIGYAPPYQNHPAEGEYCTDAELCEYCQTHF